MSYYDILMKNVKFWAFPGQGPGRVLLAEHARLIEPCRSVTLERSDRVHGKSRHRVAVRRPLTQKQCEM